MVKPYTICHILSALDGKISGDFFQTESAKNASGEYAKIRKEFNAEAWLFGTTTTKTFTHFQKPNFTSLKEEGSNKDHIATKGAKMFYVSLDTKGEIGWDSGTFKKEGRPDAHIIEIILETTDPAYRTYLKERGVSYVIAGKDSLDCKAAMEKLYHLFGIQKVLICGGGLANWSFLSQGVVDQLSIVLTPAVDGSSETPTIFERGVSNESRSLDSLTKEFKLEDINILTGNSIWLNYSVKN